MHNFLNLRENTTYESKASKPNKLKASKLSKAFGSDVLKPASLVANRN